MSAAREDGLDAEYAWPRPPEGGWTADDLDRLPNLPPHTELSSLRSSPRSDPAPPPPQEPRTAAITARATGAASPPPVISPRSAGAPSTTAATATLGSRSRAPCAQETNQA
ncbi:hypothetical protein SFUMM280S_00712 [Streptomyces fumanus]